VRAFTIADCRMSNDLMRRRSVLTSAFCILTSAFACLCFAQSNFNTRGLGEVAPSGDARVVALGDPFAFSTLNPGALVRLDRTAFHFSGIAMANIGTRNGNSRLLKDVRPSAFFVAAPLPLQFRAFAGLTEKLNQNFDIWSESMPDTAYRRHVVGRGSIQTLSVGVSKSLFNSLCAGIEYNRLMGGSRENWRFEMLSGGYTSTDTIEADYSAHTFKAGLALQTSYVEFGAYYEPAVTLTVQRLKRVHGVISDSMVTSEIRLPNSWSTALAVNPTRGLGVNLGLTMMPWSGATITKNDTTERLGFRDAWRGSIGIQYDIDSLHPVRVGFARRNWYYTATGQQQVIMPITENAITFGTSVPIPEFGSLDIAGEILFRNSMVLSETGGRLMLTLAYAEAWSKRTRNWGY
jgi:hypothetical protein